MKKHSEGGPEVMAAAFLSEKAVLVLVPLSRMTLRRMEATGAFPARRQLSPGRVAWVACEVQDWITSTPKVIAAQGVAA